MRGAGTGVVGDLTGRRSDRPAGEELRLGLPPADAHGKLGRTDAAPRALDEEALDDPVLERVERDRRQTTAGREQLPRLRQRRGELRELAVHGNAERLECPLGGMTAG